MLISISIYVHIYKHAKHKKPEGLDFFSYAFFLQLIFYFSGIYNKIYLYLCRLGKYNFMNIRGYLGLGKVKFVNSTVICF